MIQERYKKMMEREALSGEAKAAILERMEGRPARRPVRWPALIAACLCVALLGTAIAAAATGGFGLWGGTQPDGDLSVTARQKLYAEDEFSAALQRDMAAVKKSGVASVCYPADWQAARDYVGIPLLENRFLDGRETFMPSGEMPDHGLHVSLHPGLVYLYRPYEVDGLLLTVSTGIFTEEYDGAPIQGEWYPFWWGNHEADGDGTVTFRGEDDGAGGVFRLDDTWTETMPDGTEVLYTRWSGDDVDGYWLGADFVHDGIGYDLNVFEIVRGVPEIGEAFAPCGPGGGCEDVLRQAVEGFAFE